MKGIIAFYGTKDLEAVRHFYGEILGFELHKDQGVCLIYKVPGGGGVGFCNHKKVVSNPADLYITIVVKSKAEVEMLCRMLTKAGYEPKLPLQENENFQIYQVLFTDPTGYTLEIQSFL